MQVDHCQTCLHGSSTFWTPTMDNGKLWLKMRPLLQLKKKCHCYYKYFSLVQSFMILLSLSVLPQPFSFILNTTIMHQKRQRKDTLFTYRGFSLAKLETIWASKLITAVIVVTNCT
jgi:hypothetical protein